MSSIAELTQQRETALQQAEGIASAAERGRRKFTHAEQTAINSNLRAVELLSTDINNQREKSRSVADMKEILRAARGNACAVEPRALAGKRREPMCPQVLSAAYLDAFHLYAATGTKSEALNEGMGLGGEFVIPIRKSAALYTGSGAAGGYATPERMADFIAPLAPTASDIRDIATAIPTDANMLLPTTAPTGMPAPTLTPELSEFGGTPPSFAQTELQAWMISMMIPVSVQFAQDQPALEPYMRTQVESAFLEYEDTFFTEGSGSNEPQGLINNVGPGITAEPDGSGNAVSVDGCSTLLGTLKAKYLSNASWLMSQTTAVVLRKSMVEASLFYPAWHRGSDGVERLFGYPVKYSASMPSAARGNAPILFGDFARGLIIGDRGGPALRLKVIDELLASTGVLWWLLFRRTDARVWVQEAIQQYNVALS